MHDYNPDTPPDWATPFIVGHNEWGTEERAFFRDIIRLDTDPDGEVLRMRVCATHTECTENNTIQTRELTGDLAARTWLYFSRQAPHLLTDTAMRNSKLSEHAERILAEGSDSSSSCLTVETPADSTAHVERLDVQDCAEAVRTATEEYALSGWCGTMVGRTTPEQDEACAKACEIEQEELAAELAQCEQQTDWRFRNIMAYDKIIPFRLMASQRPNDGPSLWPRSIFDAARAAGLLDDSSPEQVRNERATDLACRKWLLKYTLTVPSNRLRDCLKDSGNTLLIIVPDFTRYFSCASCRHCVAGTDANFAWRNGHFRLNCANCGHEGRTDVLDKKSADNYLVIIPQDITVNVSDFYPHNHVTSWRLPAELIAGIQGGVSRAATLFMPLDIIHSAVGIMGNGVMQLEPSIVNTADKWLLELAAVDTINDYTISVLK